VGLVEDHGPRAAEQEPLPVAVDDLVVEHDDVGDRSAWAVR
jgi:hypothetical protein